MRENKGPFRFNRPNLHRRRLNKALTTLGLPQSLSQQVQVVPQGPRPYLPPDFEERRRQALEAREKLNKQARRPTDQIVQIIQINQN